MSLIWHPDRAREWVPDDLLSGATEIYKLMNTAHGVLTDAIKRNQYDQKLQLYNAIPKSVSAPEQKQADDFMKMNPH